MPVVRRRYHYAAVYLNPNVLNNSRVLCSNHVTVYDSKGWVMLELKGFINKHDCSGNDDYTVIEDIEAYTPGDTILDQWIELGKDIWLQGIIRNSGVYVVQDSGQPIVVGERIKYSRVATNNVVTLGYKK